MSTYVDLSGDPPKRVILVIGLCSTRKKETVLLSTISVAKRVSANKAISDLLQVVKVTPAVVIRGLCRHMAKRDTQPAGILVSKCYVPSLSSIKSINQSIKRDRESHQVIEKPSTTSKLSDMRTPWDPWPQRYRSV